MNPELLARAIALFEKTGYVFVATADANGTPHIATARHLECIVGGALAVAEWFCPDTIDNLQQNSHTALVIWDVALDNGYQIVGEVERVEDRAMMDGYHVAEEMVEPMPQVERRLILRPDKVLGFSHAPHSDLEEQAEGARRVDRW